MQNPVQQNTHFKSMFFKEKESSIPTLEKMKYHQNMYILRKYRKKLTGTNLTTITSNWNNLQNSNNNILISLSHLIV